MATITRTPWIDDDGTGTTGTVLNNAVKTELYNQIDELAGKIEGADTTEAFAAQHDPATGAHKAITGASVNVTGDVIVAGVLTAPDGEVNLAGYFTATANIRGANFLEANRATPVGHWQDVPYNAADFWTNAGTGTWTVPVGAVVVNRYALIGRTLLWNLYVNNTTLTVAASVLNIRMPGGLTCAASVIGNGVYSYSPTYAPTYVSVSPGGNAVSIGRMDQQGFTATGGVHQALSLAMEIQ